MYGVKGATASRLMRGLQVLRRHYLRSNKVTAASIVRAGEAFRSCGTPVRDLTQLALQHQRAKLLPLRQFTVFTAAFDVESSFDPPEMETTVGIMVEGTPYTDGVDVDKLASALEVDALRFFTALPLVEGFEHPSFAVPMELSLVLCDNEHIAELNQVHRKKEGPTDVLSFEMDTPPGYPLRVLGDVVISLDTAARQAAEHEHSLLDECRILMVHGVLHLLGQDHEAGDEEYDDMAAAESRILQALKWQGQGLITTAGSISDDDGSDVHSGERVDSDSSTSTTADIADAPSRWVRQRHSSDIQLLALDMDGTLLDSRSQVLPSSVIALKAAMEAGVTVCLATGKARPAAIAAMAKVGLAGDGLVVSRRGPGLFLQGLAVHGGDGTLLEGPDLPSSVVRAGFEYAQQQGVPLCAFLGDECVTLQMHPELEELHMRYYEPLAQVLPSLDSLLAGPPVKKLLFMTSEDVIASQVQPFWQEAVRNQGADTTMAVPNMLEIVPRGINKWIGMQLLLADLQLPREALMACGDGGNDLQLVANAGLGIAMGNAVPSVKEAAAVVTGSNDEDGIADVIERFIL